MLLTLPLDVIHYHLFPLFPYCSRNAINSLLPPRERMRTPLKEGSLEEFRILFAESKVRQLSKIFAKGTPAEVMAAAKHFDFRNLIGLQYSRSVRRSFQESLMLLSEKYELRRPDPKWISLSEVEMTTIRKYINLYSLRSAPAYTQPLKDFPFQYEYTAVDGIGNPVTVTKMPYGKHIHVYSLR